MLISDETVPLVRASSLQDEDSPRRLPLLRWLQLSSMIPAIHGVRYLCVMIPIIKRRDVDSYEKITLCKSCSYENSELPLPQLQLQQDQSGASNRLWRKTLTTPSMLSKGQGQNMGTLSKSLWSFQGEH